MQEGRREMSESARSKDRGFIMVALLVSMAVGAVWMTVLLPAWRQQSIRQKEDDLIFRGESIARAIVFYQNKNEGAFPPNLDILIQQKHLRKKYKDPFTGKDFDLFMGGQVVSGATGQPPPTPIGQASQPIQQNQQAGIQGVRSPSTATSIKIYQGQQAYNLWPFDAQTVRQLYRMPQPQRQGQGPGGGRPVPGQPGQPGQRNVPGGPPGAPAGPGAKPGGGGPPPPVIGGPPRRGGGGG